MAAGDFVKIDFGALVGGYHSDMTRTFVLGKAADWQREIYRLVSAAQQAGRRARLIGTGKDVWEVIAAVRDNDGDIAETARYLEIPLGLVQAAVTYYGAYTDEIDQWIVANEQEAAEAHAAWMAGNLLVGMKLSGCAKSACSAQIFSAK